MITLGASSLPPDLLPPPILPCTSGSFYSPSHEWILSHDVSHASEQRSASNKTACPKPRIYVDGWMKPNPESLQSMIVVILFVIHLDLLPTPIPTQSLRLVVDYKHCYQPSRERRGYGDRETDRATDSGLKIQEKKPLMAAYGPPLYRFIICGVVQDISQLCLPWTAPWVLGGIAEDCRCDYLFTNPPPLTTWIPLPSKKKKKKIHPIFFFNTSCDTINHIIII